MAKSNTKRHTMKPRAKLPVGQLAILAIARFAEPMALTSVFPYLPEMIASFGVEKTEVAYYAGLIGAVFSLSQSATAVFWGQASDRYGRKPIILLGLFCTMIGFVFWGVSSNLIMALTVRLAIGATNGNVGILRTFVAEIVPQRELQPKAFSLMPLVWSIGSIFGPVAGGTLVRPVERFPGLFGNSKFLKDYPFALPNIIAACFFFMSFMTGLLFLRESLASKRHQRDWGLVLGEKLASLFSRPKHFHRRKRGSFGDEDARTPLLAEQRTASSEQPVSHQPPAPVKIFYRQTVINLVSYTFLAFHSVTYDQVLPVFLNYPRQIPDESNTQLPFKFSGGFGLSSDRIGTIFTIYGILCGLVQFFLFPALCHRFGVLKCFRASALTFPIVYLITPYTALVQDDTIRYILFLTIMLFKGFAGIVAFPCTTILLTNSATSLSVLGTLNGYAVSFSGLGRSGGPAMTGYIFSLGVQKGYIVLPWWFLAFVALLGAIPSWYIVEGDGPSGRATESDDEEDEDEQLTVDEELLPAVDGPETLLSLEAEHVHHKNHSVGEDPDDVLPIRRFANQNIFNNDSDDLASDSDSCPPLRPEGGGSLKDKNLPPQVRMRRMSAAGHELEHGSHAHRGATHSADDVD